MTIRARLTRTLLLAILPLVLAAGLGLFLFVRSQLVSRVDAGLVSRAQALAGMLGFEKGTPELDPTHEMMPQYDAADSGEFFQIFELAGGKSVRTLSRSKSLRDTDISARVPSGATDVWNAELAGIGRLRVVAFRTALVPDHEDRDEAKESDVAEPDPLGIPVLVLVAQRRDEMDSTLAKLATAIAVVGAGLLAGMVLAVRLALGRGLLPLHRLEAEVARVGPSNLSHRIQTTGVPAELAAIAARTNELLDRLAVAFEREKRLAASAAHELRTPIAEVRAVTELALSRERSAQAYRGALETVLGAAVRMGNATDAVLRLARVQSGREAISLEPVDARAALLPAWTRLIEPLTGRGIACVLEIPEGVLVRAERAMLEVAFDNLCANASEHTSERGLVRARCIVTGSERASIQIINTCPSRELPDRAVTADVEPAATSAHDQHAGVVHAGLGLSIARSLLEACGGTLEVAVHEGVFSATLTLGRA